MDLFRISKQKHSHIYRNNIKGLGHEWHPGRVKHTIYDQWNGRRIVKIKRWKKFKSGIPKSRAKYSDPKVV